MMKLGIHNNVTIVGCFMGESAKQKTPYIGVEFENLEGESMSWIAYLGDKVGAKDNMTMTQRALKKLLEIGFIGKSVSDLADTDKCVDDLFGDVGEPLSVTVEEETDDEGKKRLKIAWINVGGSAKFDKAQAVAKVKELAVDGDLMRLRKEIKAPKKKEPKAEGQTQGDVDGEPAPW
jgi:hypothetical protein